ncbi:bacterial membrane flanked domain protein [Sphingomonas mucosissima]|uniref:Bacterial membrane flanked domain protein n=2 Tax=Sphingomonas mucosissima TaxID=370959 RepID=A0A245ZE21_9SPHN|nr:bacterial membrane flanked domain protein [Sphingomonas mucosissima]
MTLEIEPQLLAVEPGYRNVLRVRLAAALLAVTTGAIAIDQLLLRATTLHGVLTALVPLFAIISIAVVPQRIYRRLGYRLAGEMLHSVHGWTFHTDTLVPFVRVQHLDVTRGLLDKLFGTASLVVHTAGTHNSTVTINGLSPERAAEIRDVIREHVRSDVA